MKAQIRYKNNDLNQMLSQRLSYEKHKKKLEELAKRKTDYISTERLKKLKILKQRKHLSFIKDIQQRNKQISVINLKIFEKLSFTHDNKQLTNQQNNSNSSMSPFKKKKICETYQENLRIYDKLRSLSPSINNKKIQQQYIKTKQIKNRISRYQSMIGNKKILLKSQKFLNFSLSQTARSNINFTKSRLINNHQNKRLKINYTKLGQKLRQYPKLFNQFYNKQQIIKNKIVQPNTKNYLKRRLLYVSTNMRPQTENNMRSNHKPIQKNNNNDQIGLFFATEMHKKQQINSQIQNMNIQSEKEKE